MRWENTPIGTLLKDRGLSIEELARKTLCSLRVIQGWLGKATMPQRLNRRSIAKVLGVDEMEIRLLTVRQKMHLDGLTLNRYFSGACCACLMAARLNDTHLLAADVEVANIDELLSALPQLRDRIQSLKKPKKRRLMRPPMHLRLCPGQAPASGVLTQPDP